MTEVTVQTAQIRAGRPARRAGLYLAEVGLSAAVLLDQMLQLVVDVLLSAAHLLQSLTDVLLQFVQVALQRQEEMQQDTVSIYDLNKDGRHLHPLYKHHAKLI